ncbi:MAG: response regulator [Verrucomicrobia bacterium]|nr:response regulator [Verrucomicrobiota bacterium]
MFLVRSGGGTGGAKGLSLDEAARLTAIAADKQGKTASILVVDDSRTLRKLLVRSLNEQGYHNITEAVDGQNALELARQREFDLVLLDIEMPVMDGFGVLKNLMDDPVLRDLPVIVISGQEQEESAVRCIEMGAEDYLPKPYNPVLLRARVTSSLEKKRLRDLDRLRLAELQLEKEMLQIEKEKSERLLLNILPRPIADRLKGGEKTIADNYHSVTVLFADLVGFTHFSSRTDASELVNMLNQIFTAFDRLVEKHSLEKIKTIGDSYMVVGGLPVPLPNHAEAVAQMALEMLDAITTLNYESGTDRAIRIGMNTGPVVAGVIGRKKFSYDLWGSTVNLAARLESGGVPGHIHVSQSTYEVLRDQFAFTERGVIHAKGVGDITTYFLNGKRS